MSESQYLINRRATMLGIKPVEIKEKGKQEARKEQEKEYLKLKKEFLKAHPNCQVKDCKKPAKQVHHMRGRIGKLLTDTSNFLAVCAPCHRKIEANPAWSRQEGYSLSRLSK